jgi:hypothetical protein
MSRTLRAFALCLLASALITGSAWAQDDPLSHVTDVRVVSVPKDDWAAPLAWATWIMVVANALLCAVTWVGARNQSRDMQASIAVGKASVDAAGRSADAAVRSSEAASVSAQLAARQQRDILERETNIVAHRVATLAARVLELVTLRVNLSNRLYRDFDSSPEKQKLDEISADTQEAARNAEAVLAPSTAGPKQDGRLAGELRQLDRHQVVLEAFKERVMEEIDEVRRLLRESQESAQRMQDRAEAQMREMRNHR